MKKVFGLVGYSGVGKTTLIERLLAHFVAQGWRVSVIKHTHHTFDLDRPGKDSWRHRAAGANEVLLAGAQRWVLMHELRNETEPEIEQQLAQLSPCDLVLVEGYKRSPIPKLELWRSTHTEAIGRPMRFVEDPYILAVASDLPQALPTACPLPILHLDDVAGIADLIVQTLHLTRADEST